MIRIDKLISSQTRLSRREAAQAVRMGQVTVNGEVLKNSAQKINPTDAIALFGQTVDVREHVYIMMNKPAGVLCVSRDSERQTVIDLLPEEWRRSGLFPAGRLDKDTTGMVLLTDDGDFAHALLSPRRHVPKTYLVALDRPVDSGAALTFRKGIVLSDGEKCLSAECVPMAGNTASVTLHEGKYHQIKRMFAALGFHVTALTRLSMGGLDLDPSLAPGESRLLSESEILSIFPFANW